MLLNGKDVFWGMYSVDKEGYIGGLGIEYIQIRGDDFFLLLFVTVWYNGVDLLVIAY